MAVVGNVADERRKTPFKIERAKKADNDGG